MIKLEIIKRKNNQLIGYFILFAIIITLVIIPVFRTNFFNVQFDKIDYTLGFGALIIGYITIQIYPNISHMKYSNLGFIEFDTNSFSVYRDSKILKFDIRELDLLSIKINGYDGQPITGGPKQVMTFLNRLLNSGLPCVNGLRNNLLFTKNHLRENFEFYIKNKSDYIDLVNHIQHWSNIKEFKINILR